MNQIIAFINQKGGVGKTTTTASIGAALRLKGYTTLMIDLDPQNNLTYITGADNRHAGAFELLTQGAEAADVIQTTAQGDVIGSSMRLATENILTGKAKEYRLRNAIEPLQSRYDFILIDCPPTLGILAINALVAATGVIIPVGADIFSLQAIGQFAGTFEAVRRHTNKELKLFGLVLTRYSARAVLSQQVAEMITQTAGQLKTKVYKTPIRESIAIKESQATREDIFTHAPRSNAAADFKALTAEILKDMEG